MVLFSFLAAVVGCSLADDACAAQQLYDIQTRVICSICTVYCMAVAFSPNRTPSS